VGEREAFLTGTDGDIFPSDLLFQNFQNSCLDNSYRFVRVRIMPIICRNCLGYRRRVFGELLPFSWLTYDDVARRVNNFGSGLCLVSPHLKIGDAVLIISENSPEWIICEQACMMHGFIVVSASHTSLYQS
jgi:acyl-coenzyme A synthetase/AMP-(fatty) acid ligase